MATKKSAKKAVAKKPATKKTVLKRAPSGKDAAATYRRLALALPGAVQDSHMDAADFRIELGKKRRIFATLAYEARGLGTLLLAPEQQAAFLADAPQWFEPVPGGWGRMGATLVRLNAPESVLADALETAHRHTLGKMETKKHAPSRARS